jgi:uncharacterized membrane protein YebE (DUF533 family)
MFDAKRLLNQYLGGEAAGGAAGNTSQMGGLLSGALAGGLVGLLTGTRTGRKVGKNALVYGGTALVGGLAYKAWRDWQGGKQAATVVGGDGGTPTLTLPPADSAFVPAPDQKDSLERGLIRAMIGAAKSDGHIDGSERQRILQRIDSLDLDAGTDAFVRSEMAGPLDLDAIVAPATCPETAAEIYTASLIAVDRSRPAERGYLAMLAARLALEPGLVEHLHANVDAALSETGKQ